MISLGLPARCPITTKLLVIIPRCARSLQLGLTRLASTSRSMSPSCDKIATSESNPEAIARACAPEPLYDSLNSIERPVFFFHSALKAGTNPRSTTSRTTEYAPIESLVRVRVLCLATARNDRTEQRQTQPRCQADPIPHSPNPPDQRNQ